MTGHTAEFVLDQMPLHRALGFELAWHLTRGRSQIWPEVKAKAKSAILDRMDAAFTGGQ
jgi:hypothetical protein